MVCVLKYSFLLSMKMDIYGLKIFLIVLFSFHIYESFEICFV